MRKERATNAFFVLTHPREALKVKLRQIAVSIETEEPPCTSTYEEFPELSLKEAIMAIRRVKKPVWGPGVPKEAWSKDDQERMERGELPKGRPLHPNV